MNIDTIKKYKNAFDHFVNGGKLLWARARDSKLSWLKATGNHQEFFNTNDEYYIYIIDDEYVEFRKALAEGKIIQYNFGIFGSNKTDFPNIWKDLDLSIGILSDRSHPQNYRIKPEEPEFKVGNWVTEQGVLRQIPEPINVESLNNHLALYERRCKKWKPRVGELVVMATEDYSTGFTVTPWEENSKFVPVPFTGELPK